MSLSLGDIIKILEGCDPDLVMLVGFCNPHSFRGNYHALGVEPKRGATVRESLECLRSALGEIYEGYKGGGYKMEKWSDVYFANYGSSAGDEIGAMLLNAILGVDLLTGRETEWE